MRLNTLYIIFILFGVSFGIFLYKKLLNFIFKTKFIADKDPFNNIVFTYNGKGYSWWPISHFLIHFFLTLLFPESWGILILFGIIWELIENIIFVK